MKISFLFFLVILISLICPYKQNFSKFHYRQGYYERMSIQKLNYTRKYINKIPFFFKMLTVFNTYTINLVDLFHVKQIKQIGYKIEQLSKIFEIHSDMISIISGDCTSEFMYDNKLIMSLTKKDAYYAQIFSNNLAFLTKEYIVEFFKKLKKIYELEKIFKNSALVMLIVTFQIILIWITNLIYQNLSKKVWEIRKKILKPLFIKNYKFIGVERQIKIFFFFLKFVRLILILIECFASILFLFSCFPQTKGLVFQFLLLFWNPIEKIWIDIVNYLPNLCTVVIIWIIFRYVVKGLKIIASEIERERFRLNGFYPEWAKPTFGIFRFLLYAFMVALIYPHLPHSESEAFKGVSVLVGLIFSIGSSSAIGNLVAGIIITYMRSFKIGDRIKIGEIIGDVIEKTPIVTRILTLKNEIITIPNATVTNTQIINLTESAKTKGLIVHCEVTFGYDKPWRQIHQILLDGADSTPQVLKNPHPFVLETAFDDFYTTYQVNVYIDHANQLLEISSELRQNIQDKFKEAGLNMTSHHYYNNNKCDK